MAEAFLGYERRRTHPAQILDVWFSDDSPTLMCYLVYADRDGGVHARRLVGTIDQDYHAD